MFMRTEPEQGGRRDAQLAARRAVRRASIDLIAEGPQGRRGEGEAVDRQGPVHRREGQGGRPDRRRRAPPGLRGDAEAEVRRRASSFDRKYGSRRSRRLDFSNPFAMFKILGEVMAGGEEEEAGEPTASRIVYVDGMILPGKRAAVALRRRRRVQHRHPQGARRGRARRLGQGGRAARRLARRQRRRQRDHPRRHQAREGEEAVRRLDGQRRRQRRVLRRLRRRHDLRRRDDDHRLDRRRRRQVRHHRRCGTRSASPSRPTTAARTPACSSSDKPFTDAEREAAAGVDGRDLRRRSRSTSPTAAATG